VQRFARALGVELIWTLEPLDVSQSTMAAQTIFRAPSRNPIFTGRDQLLTDLDAALASGTHTALVQAITGMGGAGKTQLAIEYAHRFGDSYDVAWWVNAEQAG
jgi:predicted HAD superfamily phosphohydrolase YqeG